MFFADADYDRILSVTHPKNVILTDYNDLEGYALASNCLVKMCLNGFGSSESDAAQLLPRVMKIGRPIGMLRIASLRNKLNLAFQLTFQKGLKKFVQEIDGEPMLDVLKFITTLIQNTLIKKPKIDIVQNLMKAEESALAARSDDEVIHGKDLIMIVSWLLDAKPEEIGRLLFVCIDYTEISKLPNISLVATWLTNRQP